MAEFELPGNEDIKNVSKGRKFFHCCKNVLLGRKDEKPLTAQEAYFKTKYGDISSLGQPPTS